MDVETSSSTNSSVLVARWEGKTSSCYSSLMLSVLSTKEERISRPVSGASGTARLTVEFTCEVLEVRLAALVPGKAVAVESY